MELFFLLSIGMSIVALLPIALSESQLLSNQQNQQTQEAILMAGVETTFPTESLLLKTQSVQLSAAETPLASSYHLEVEGTQRASRTVLLQSDKSTLLKSAV